MKRPNRTLEIFSISALDLFASALGAFILVAVILFPYYLKNFEVVADNKQMAADLQAMKTKLAAAEAEAEEQKQKAATAQAQADAAEARAKAASAQAASAAKAAKAASAAASAAAKTRGSTIFALLGINTKAKTFVVLIDMSQSMQQYSRLMVRTLDKLLAPMESDIKITIIGFQEINGQARLHPWTTGGQLVPMTSQNKARALNFAKGLAGGFNGRTPTFAALRRALNMNVQSIILLSDGAPTDAPWQSIVGSITQANGGRKEINCVALGDFNKHPNLVAFLQSLARRNKGDFTGVSG